MPKNVSLRFFSKYFVRRGISCSLGEGEKQLVREV